MATLFSYGGKDVVIDQSQKEACIQEILQKIIAQQGREPQKILLLPPDMTRLHSDAGNISQIIYKLLSSKAHIDIMPAIGSHFAMTEEEIREIAGPGGALEAFVEARLSGKVRFIGVTGHHDPRILTRAVREWPIDSVMMPVNPVEKLLGGFLTLTLPVAKEKGIAIIGMKILGGSQYLISQLGITPESLIRYALSQAITVAIVGCSTADEVRTLAQEGCNTAPMAEKEKVELLEKFTPYAERLAFYRGVI